MTRYYVDVRHVFNYKVPVAADEASSAREASSLVSAMVDDGAMPEDIGEFDDDNIEVGLGWIELSDGSVKTGA